MPAPISIASLSPFAEDHEVLAHILQPLPIHRASTLSGAMQLPGGHQISVVVCEQVLPWKDLLAEVCGLAKPPQVIVTSLHADDYLWAEALNLGAHDVLLKPFDPAEVRRSVSIAVLHWRLSQELGGPRLTAAGA